MPFLRTTDSFAHLDIDVLRSDLSAAVAAGDLRREMRCCGLIAEWQRSKGDDARPMAERAVQLARQVGDERNVTVNRLRLATARFYQGEHAEAETELRALIVEIEAGDDQTLLHFAHQHLGKCLAEQGRYSEAITAFEAALAGRTDPALIESSRAAIALARSRLAG